MVIEIDLGHLRIVIIDTDFLSGYICLRLKL